jgi:hypothetical protein
MGPGQRRQAVGERRREAATRKGRGFMGGSGREEWVEKGGVEGGDGQARGGGVNFLVA